MDRSYQLKKMTVRKTTQSELLHFTKDAILLATFVLLVGPGTKSLPGEEGIRFGLDMIHESHIKAVFTPSDSVTGSGS